MQKQSMSSLSSLKSLAAAHADLSWIKNLTCDAESAQHQPNKRSRQVLNGHYVLVRPTPLPNPTLVHVSASLLNEIGLSESIAHSDPDFIHYFSGTIPLPSNSNSNSGTADSSAWGTTWATPYALSIYGQEMYDNCPFKNGNGYGDGRAISIGEIGPLPWNGARYEFQLKGSGTTPFCRGGDGRAVFRSSIREFLASEAMHHLGISTTRALSLCVSQSETVDRPWYDANTGKGTDIPSTDDPRLARVPPEYRAQLIQQIIMQARSPTRMITEQCAITCRVASSFIRVGHIELFSRRVEKTKGQDKQALLELQQIADHLMEREYSNCTTILQMLHSISIHFAKLTSDWIRVGYCQGNFNSDNCLVAGRTMDYGPFGFIEKFSPNWNMWVGGGDHYSFMNQNEAGFKNFETLVHSLLPLLTDTQEKKEALLLVREGHHANVKQHMNRMWSCKLGLLESATATDIETMGSLDETAMNNVITSLLLLMEQTECDWTLTWRQLSVIVERMSSSGEHRLSEDDMLMVLRECFYSDEKSPLNKGSAYRTQWIQWLHEWSTLILSTFPASSSTASSSATSTTNLLLNRAKTMKSVSPKYVPREWMLVEAYEQAQKGAYDRIKELSVVFEHPYDEGTAEYENKYYKKTLPDTYDGVGKGGTSFMS